MSLPSLPPTTNSSFKMAYHLEALQRLRTLRNERASWTQRLPLHVLCNIFMIYRDVVFFGAWSTSYPPSLTTPRTSIAAVPWIVPSYVCQHWRKVLLESPDFWAVLPLNCVKWTEVLLSRSRNALLHLRPFSHSDPLQEPLIPVARFVYWTSLQLALRECHRIVQLSVVLPKQSFLHDEKVMVKAFRLCSFPELRALQIIVLTPALPGQLHEYDHRATGKFLLGVHKWLPPHLYSLRVYWKSVMRGGHQSYTVAFFLHILHSLPLLEHLTIRCILQNAIAGLTLDRCVHMRLKSLTISSMVISIRTVATLINHLYGPPNMKILMTGFFRAPVYWNSQWVGGHKSDEDDYRELEESLPALFSSLSRYLGNYGYSKSRSYSIRSILVQACLSGFRIFLSRTGKVRLQENHPYGSLQTNEPCIYHPNLDSSDISIEIQDYPHGQDGPLEVTVVLASILFPLTLDLFHSSEHIFLFECQGAQVEGVDTSVNLWAKALLGGKHLKELELCVSEQTLRSVHDVLIGWKEGGVGMDEISLPYLETITFREYRFASRPLFHLYQKPLNSLELKIPSGSSVTSDPTFNGSPSSHSALHILTTYILDPFILPPNFSDQACKFINALTVRKAAGFPLRKLSFLLCSSFTEEIVREYRNVVEEVFWDKLDHKIWDSEDSDYSPTAENFLESESEEEYI
ncbi:hypothetical protein DL96DRAFT_1712516 [Flagelloscypha sp. PMI_526]|nr:hypothetical protein DL96DRAFT_1712516 [Flagelloscypha sp. PMI_526]